MKIIKIKNLNGHNLPAINAAGESLNRGQVIILPTSTIYGLSCRYDHYQAVKEIYKLKQRSQSMPLILLVSSRQQLNTLIEKPTPAAKKLIDLCWFSSSPLPVTLILEKRSSLPPYITASSPHIAIRYTGSYFLRRLIDKTGPITSTSATISGSKNYPDRIENIPESIRQGVPLIVQSGQPLAGKESTIINITTLRPSLVREGVVKYEHIMKMLKNN
ncbi:MAG: threonylcarbamoyl-AMP synthase [Actinomycetia bacterium]|nr:threonylcarbamoyl-AMP synthase [Actinomycetes bacterium]